MNEIVKYHNNLSELPLKSFSSSELDILMTLCSKCKYQGTKKVSLTFKELRQLTGYKNKNNKYFIRDIERTNKKLLKLNMRLENEHKIIQFVLFPYFEIDKDNYVLNVRVNEEFAYLLNSLDNNFTRFELEEFVSLKSTYAKACYRQLKRFRDTGWWNVSIEELRELLDVPESYTTSEFTRKAINPIIEELTPLFEKFTVEAVRSQNKKGRPIVGYKFNWDEEKRYKDLQQSQKAKADKSYQETGFKCPVCGEPLIFKEMNGRSVYCHLNWNEEGHCKKIYNSVAEIKDYQELPTRRAEDDQSGRTEKLKPEDYRPNERESEEVQKKNRKTISDIIQKFINK